MKNMRWFLFPFLFTFLNGLCGLLSIIFAVENSLLYGALAIFAAALMDAVDGRVARKMQLTSAFGKELDSLCDALSFCVAPAILLYRWRLYTLPFVGVACLAIFVFAGLFRLARFNVQGSPSEQFFVGLPAPIAALFCTQLVIYPPFHGTLPLSFVLMLLILISLLMISNVEYPSFKQNIDKVYVALMLIMSAFFFYMSSFPPLFALVFSYILIGLIRKLRLF